MAGNNDFHARTLPHVASQLHISGRWPAPIVVTRNWSKAHARPWNDDAPEAFLRLERGGAPFLREVAAELALMTGHDVLSPAVFGSSARVWERSGFEPQFELYMMEKRLGRNDPEPGRELDESTDLDWERITAIDSAAFPPFWRMSVAGLTEAATTATTGATLTISDDVGVVGFAIVGIQWSVSYLQRIAVHPDRSGSGFGSDLVRGAASWARRRGAPVMILNVRPENERAISVYEKEGFRRTSTSLNVLRYAA